MTNCMPLLEENENDGNPKHLDAMRAELRRRSNLM
jgi:hypothetical protein